MLHIQLVVEILFSVFLLFFFKLVNRCLKIDTLINCDCGQVWMELLSQAPQQYVVAASCPWMGAWLCLMMQPSHIPIDINMLLEVKARLKVLRFIHKYMKPRTWILL